MSHIVDLLVEAMDTGRPHPDSSMDVDVCVGIRDGSVFATAGYLDPEAHPEFGAYPDPIRCREDCGWTRLTVTGDGKSDPADLLNTLIVALAKGPNQ